MNPSEIAATTWQKLTVAGTAFCVATAAFAFSFLIRIPLLGAVLHTVGAPQWFQQGNILVPLFVPPSVGALWGLGLGLRILQPKSKAAT